MEHGDEYHDGIIAYSVARENFISIQKTFERTEDDIRYLLIAHELLHDLGFEHQSKEFDSLLNEGEILLSKIYSNPIYKAKLKGKLPKHDIELIINRYFD